MTNTLKRVAAVATCLLLSPTLTACPNHPTGTRTVAVKRSPCSTKPRPCSRDPKTGKINENNCWQLQYVITPGNKQEFECVSKEVWDHTKIGDRG